MNQQPISRRSFVKGASLGAIACSAAAVAPASALAQEKAPSFVPGVYHGAAKGRTDDLTVAVTLSEHAIESVEVTSLRDSRLITDVPVSRIPAQIVRHQSTAVDIVSGATLTSLAIIRATEDALASAGVDPASMRVPFEPDPVVEPPVGDARIGIVGGGVAGLCAAVRAAQLQIPVVLFEQSARLGGDALFAGGYSWGVDTMMQKAAGVEDSSELMYREFTVDRYNPDSPKIWYEDAFRKLIDGSGRTIDWLDSYVGARYHNREITQGCYGWDLTPRVCYLDGGYNLVEPLVRKVEEGVRDGYVTVLTEHAVTDLMTDEAGSVCGVVAKNRLGVEQEYPFEAVLMATGGFAANAEMRAEYIGPNVQTFTPSTCNGSGFKILGGLGAGFENMYTTPVYGASLVTDDYGFVRYMVDEAYPYAFWVTSGGTRLGDELQMGTNSAWKHMPDHVGYVVFPKAKRLDQRSIVQRGGFGEAEPALTPWEGWDLFDALLEEGRNVWEADTIEELAQKMGVNAENLAQTCAAITEAHAAGTADEFGREKLCEMTGPFYGMKAFAYVIYSQTATKADVDYRVLKEDGSPIGGVYVAGQLLGLQLPPTTRSQGGNGLSGCYPNQGRMAIEGIIAELYGIETEMPYFETTAVPEDYEGLLEA